MSLIWHSRAFNSVRVERRMTQSARQGGNEMIDRDMHVHTLKMVLGKCLHVFERIRMSGVVYFPLHHQELIHE